ncbi:MAG TPA: twin transmembrane helix small protein [Burkholderiaceae bacterium]|nr:twin transmembrane helix small protein [Burkholderiaceae bacterium]
MKWVILIAFVLIIASLGSAAFFLIRDRGRTRNMLRALGVRVALSVALFVFILVAHQLGWIESTGIPVTRTAPR